ncbi:MAG: hypothetical protein P8Y04_13175, partial [Desulfobulbaceae bacterium]
DELKRNVIDSLTENNVDDIFNKAQNEIDLTFDRLREKLFELDKTIADTSKKYRGKGKGKMMIDHLVLIAQKENCYKKEIRNSNKSIIFALLLFLSSC